MITRFVPVGYQPQWTNEPIVDKVKRAGAGLGDLIDDYEFHYPYEINEDNGEAVKGSLVRLRDLCGATGVQHQPGVCSRRREPAAASAAAEGQAPQPGVTRH